MVTLKMWLRLGTFVMAATSAGASPQLIQATQSAEQSRGIPAQIDEKAIVIGVQPERHSAKEESRKEAGTSRRAAPSKSGQHKKSKIEPLVQKASANEHERGPRSERRSVRSGSSGKREEGEEREEEINTRYIFGFTEGADTEERGEKEIESDLQGRLAKRSGKYLGLQDTSELEFGITDRLMVEAALFGSYHRIEGVPDFENRNAARFNGASAEVKYRFLDRDVHGFGLAFSVEPEWHLYSDVTGLRETSYGVELKLYADKELIPDKLFVAGNLSYESEAVLAQVWERESGLQASAAISGAPQPGLFLGAELRYLATYEGGFLNHLQGRALLCGTDPVRAPVSQIDPYDCVLLAGRGQSYGTACSESRSAELRTAAVQGPLGFRVLNRCEGRPVDRLLEQVVAIMGYGDE